MFSKVLNYPAASSTTNAHARFVAASSTAVSSSASTSSSSFNYDNLRLDDILCAVCQSVLIEPVFLPCQHLFCRSCIRETIETNKLCCPCCRKRFGTWYRNASRANELVHEQLWRAIQSQFREHLDEDNPSAGSSKRSATHQTKPLYTARKLHQSPRRMRKLSYEANLSFFFFQHQHPPFSWPIREKSERSTKTS